MERKISDVTAVILAGGLGMRLRSLVNDRPKVMADIGGKPFLEYVLSALETQGIREVILCIGYMADAVRDYFGDAFNEISISYCEERMLLGTGGAIRFALPMIESDPFLVLNGDSLCDWDLNDFYASHLAKKAEASILLTSVENTLHYGRVRFDAESRVTEFEPYGIHSGRGWINAGLYLLSKSIVSGMRAGERVSLEHEILPRLIGSSFFACCTESERFIDIGAPEAMDRARKIFAPAAPEAPSTTPILHWEAR